MEMFFVLVGLSGGLGLFLFGLHMVSDTLQKASATKIKAIFSKITGTPIKGVLFGIVFTFLLQGSTTANLLMVSFVSSGFITFPNALAVMLGSAIGTTFTVQLIAFKITDYALLFVIIGVGLYLSAKKRNHRYAGQVILGLGFLFYGMGVMSSSMIPLKDNLAFVQMMAALGGKPFLLMVISTVFTAIIHNSAATLALGMSLANEGVLTMTAAIPLMLGANIGTTATALFSDLASTRDAKRAALANFLFKFIGALLLFPFITHFTTLVLGTSKDIYRQIANAHTFFNIMITMLFLPFLSVFSKLIFKILPEKAAEVGMPQKATRFLDDTVLDLPDIALWHIKNEIMNTGKLIENKMLPRLQQYYRLPEEDIVEDIIDSEQQINSLYLAISTYITNLAQRDLHEEHSQQHVKYLYIINELEHIGDIIVRLAMEQQKAVAQGIGFLPKDLQDLHELFVIVRANYARALKGFEDDDFQLAAGVIREQPEVLKLEKDLRFYHFSRMTSAEHGSAEASSIYLDMVNSILRINFHAVGICQTVIGIV